MATQASIDLIQELYIAYYGRPADAGGLTFWATTLEQNGGSLASVVNAFATSAESAALYGSNVTPEALITAIYQNLLHRAPDAAGLTFYTNALATGTFTAGNLALAILGGVQNADVLTVQAELTAANQFTAAATTYSGDTAAVIGRTFLSQVSTDGTTEAALLTHLSSYVNATSAATTDPTQFANEISPDGLLTSTTIVDTYASGTTPTTGITVAQAASLTPGSTYSLNDTWSNVSNAANAAIVGGAAGYAISDIGAQTNITVAQASVLAHASNYASGTDTYTLSDTAANLAADAATNNGAGTYVTAGHDVTVTDAASIAQISAIKAADATGTLTYNLADSLTNLDRPANSAIVSGHDYTLTDPAALGALSVANAAVAAGASNFVSGGYGYSLSDTAANLAADAGTNGGAGTVVTADHNVTVTNAASIAQITAIHHADSTGTLTYSLKDTLADLDNAANSTMVSGHSYSLTDPAALGILSVANARVAAGASNFASGNYTYSLSDTAANLAADAAMHDGAGTAVTTGRNVTVTDSASVAQIMAIRHADATGTLTYSLADSLANLDNAANRTLVSGHSYSLTDPAALGALSVANAAVAAGASNFTSGGYMYSLNDTAANLIADAATNNGAGTYVTAGHDVTVTDAASIAQISAIKAADATGTLTYNLADSLANLDNPANSAVVSGHSYRLTDATTLGALSVADAAVAAGASNFTSDDYTYSLSDTAANLVADAATHGGTGTYVTTDQNVTVTDAASIAQIAAIETARPQTLTWHSLSDTAANLASDAATNNGTGTFVGEGLDVTVTDSASVLQIKTIGHADSTGTLTYSLSDTWSHVSDANNAAIVSGATSYSISNIAAETGITVAQAGVLTHASNYDAGTDTYTLSDTSTNILDSGASAVDSGASAITMSVDGTGSGVLATTGAATLNITGSAALTLTLLTGAADTVIATDFAGSLYLTDSAHGDTITTGSGTATITESSNTTVADSITFGSHGTNTDTLILNAAGQQTDSVTGFVAGQDVIQLSGAATMAVGNELSASGGLVPSENYTNATQFNLAVQGVTGASAGDAIAWLDGANGNTYVAVFEGATPGHAHVVELVGMATWTGMTSTGNGIHVGSTLSPS
ncbi:hypothetical protein DR64_7573 [Paraburkholderia xenovorans LB400]|uniref:DUF4214 domain-containing protein n=1 Tax=Paraburkholderia xenovorans (strain LB400) TaxID=266265 RepID=Q13GN6_PARXL|nr:DUF4214 domain-containing protein [Paraburkholderia xenovorans]ABE36753.1 hypothetical protein Bxe_C0876 [Paraburkholderia xenovorans LB400]AIP35092.1 hypothetical protein DR64_7573 [Paraburkholderia xenovorans LB400]